MDRRVLVAVLFATLAVQLWYFSSRKPEETPVDPAVPVAAPAPNDGYVPPADLPVVSVPLSYCKVQSEFTTDGGYLRDVVLTDYKDDLQATPLWKWAWHRITGATSESYHAYRTDVGPAVVYGKHAQALGMGVGSFDAVSPRVAVTESSDKGVTVSGLTPENIEVTRSIHVREDCLLDVEVTWKNTGAGTYNGKLWLSAVDHLAPPLPGTPEATAAEEAGSPGVAHTRTPLGMIDGSVSRWADLTDLDEPQTTTGPVQWFGVADYYFGSFLLPAQGGKGTLTFARRGALDSGMYGSFYVVESTLQPGESVTERFRMYSGPLDMDKLAEVDPSLSSALNLGIFGFFGRLLLWLLKFFHSAVGNWGLAIVCVTVLVKVLFYPLTQKAFVSGQAMQALQPKMTEIREKYADNPEEMNRQIMALYSEGGVNPLGGCLPMLVQMPIFMALYGALQTSVDLYQSEFLYLKDLSSMDPYGISPLIVVGLMWAQQQTTPMGQMDPAQQRMMKLMPIIFGIFFFTSPSGLVVYMFVNMVLTMAQQWLIKRNYKAVPVG